MEKQDLAYLKRLFDAYATVVPHGAEKAMTLDGFMQAMTPPKSAPGISAPYYRVLFDLADVQKRGSLSLHDFISFQTLLTKSDADYQLAFRLFDTDGTGVLTKKAFEAKLNADIAHHWPAVTAVTETRTAPLSLYFGSEKQTLDYKEFCQVLKAIQVQRLADQFRKADPQRTGFIDIDAFVRIMEACHTDLLSPFVASHLSTLGSLYAKSKMSFANVMAVHHVVSQLHTIETIITRACDAAHDKAITKFDFQNMASQIAPHALMTPMEVDVLFHFASINNPSAKLSLGDFSRLFEPHWEETPQGAVVSQAVPPPQGPISTGYEVLKSAYHFGLGAIAGGIGATVVYPIDLVKTRMQNQRSTGTSGLLYKNSMDCFRKVISNEGIRGLYRGLGPQLIGVAPEKAIKLTMNDLVRSYLTDPNSRHIPLWGEVMAGCVAGGSQVIFTNPLEIVKIRLQVAGETMKRAAAAAAPVQPTSAFSIVKSLGLVGLYKGAGACLLRDIPFSAVYFTAYAHLKKDMFGESAHRKLRMHELLLAGAIAGMPAAYLTTPADVIKTRLQVKARQGEQTYRGITDAFRKILKEEGSRAFFKGGVARVLRSSPQFGVTLMSYELLQKAMPFDKLTGSTRSDALPCLNRETELSWLRSRNAVKILMDMDYQGFLKTSPSGRKSE